MRKISRVRMRNEEGKVKKPSSDDSSRLKDVNASCYFHHTACHRRHRVLRGVLLFWSEDHRGETAGSHSSICMKFGFFSLCAHIQTKARTQTNHKTAHKVQPDSAVMLYSYLLRRGCLFLWTPLRPGGWVSVEIFLFEWQIRAEGETGGGVGFGIRTSEYTNASNQLSHRSEQTSSWTTKDEREREERVSSRHESEHNVVFKTTNIHLITHNPLFRQHLHMLPEVWSDRLWQINWSLLVPPLLLLFSPFHHLLFVMHPLVCIFN